MKLLTIVLLLIVTTEAARCKLKCDAPFIKNKEEVNRPPPTSRQAGKRPNPAPMRGGE